MIFKDDVRMIADTLEEKANLGLLSLGLLIVDSVYKYLTDREVTITSISDGRHKRKSAHWDGRAADLRLPSWYGDEFKRFNITVRDALAERLGPQWDVILEGNHFHMEFDPK